MPSNTSAPDVNVIAESFVTRKVRPLRANRLVSGCVVPPALLVVFDQ
jgi:hypothetical protein